jgi:transcriptional regulator EpsA
MNAYLWLKEISSGAVQHSRPGSATAKLPVMAFFSSLPADDIGRYSRIIQQVLGVRSHFDLLRWLQGDVQHYLPHQIMIAAWGDFDRGQIYYDIVSSLPGVRTGQEDPISLAPVLQKLFLRWVAQDQMPYTLGTMESGFLTYDSGTKSVLGGALKGIRSSVVHGIRDQRDHHDSLYLICTSGLAFGDVTRSAMEVLLPYLDSALRKVALLPRQMLAEPAASAARADSHGLTDREVEIMQWVKMGKTNHEIGTILNISTLTVKSHLKRIFSKIDVYNRMQAVNKLGTLSGNA